jgi:hypothetical protein
MNADMNILVHVPVVRIWRPSRIQNNWTLVNSGEQYDSVLFAAVDSGGNFSARESQINVSGEMMAANIGN